MKQSPGFAVLAVLAVTLSLPATTAGEPYRPAFEERVAAWRAIEAVYWSHRHWPERNPGRKPEIDRILTAASLHARVEESQAAVRDASVAASGVACP